MWSVLRTLTLARTSCNPVTNQSLHLRTPITHSQLAPIIHGCIRGNLTCIRPYLTLLQPHAPTHHRPVNSYSTQQRQLHVSTKRNQLAVVGPPIPPSTSTATPISSTFSYNSPSTIRYPIFPEQTTTGERRRDLRFRTLHQSSSPEFIIGIEEVTQQYFLSLPVNKSFFYSTEDFQLTPSEFEELKKEVVVNESAERNSLASNPTTTLTDNSFTPMSGVLWSSPPYRNMNCSDLRRLAHTPLGPEMEKLRHGQNSIVLCGWLQSSRHMGEQWFGYLRDHSGEIQLTWTKKEAEETNQLSVYESLAKLPLESCVRVQGSLQSRPQNTVNKSQPMGDSELRLSKLIILSTNTSTLPFSLETGEPAANEDHRLKYRYLDLRRPWMQSVLRLRSSIVHACRNHFHEEGFMEIETPILFKSTPEGADEFIVPTRHAGRFYALPQSPQQHKQLLMCGGVSKYFQIARCFRDEGQRADRQPEFTQIDMEMAFVRQVDVMDTIERMMKQILQPYYEVQTPTRLMVDYLLSRQASSILKGISKLPLNRMTYQQAMNLYGVDKPDTRYPLQLQDLTSLIRATLTHSSDSLTCPVFSSVLSQPDGCIKALPVPGLGGNLTRKELDGLQATLGKGVLIVRVKDGELKTPAMFQSLFSHVPFVQALNTQLGTPLESNDLLLIAAAPSLQQARDTLGKARIQVAHKLVDKKQLTISAKQMNMFWVVDFPLFDFTLPIPSSEEATKNPNPSLTLNTLKLTAMHHPFTAPVNEDAATLTSLINNLNQIRVSMNLSSVRDVPLTPQHLSLLRSIRGQHYDLVCNGVELGGGSIRIHDAALQQSVLELLGAPLETFQHLLTALRFGAPPHGGMALGLDRIVGLVGAGLQEAPHHELFPSTITTPSTGYGLSLPIREVIAFPKTTTGQDLLVDGPSHVPTETQLQYHITSLTKEEEENILKNNKRASS